jgi:hypothetical protein
MTDTRAMLQEAAGHQHSLTLYFPPTLTRPIIGNRLNVKLRWFLLVQKAIYCRYN